MFLLMMLLAARTAATFPLGVRRSITSTFRPSGFCSHRHFLRGRSTAAPDSTEQAPSSFSHERMAEDRRYQGNAEIPESLLRADTNGFDNKFSIRGKFREGRAAYLDMSATTPLDPRVFDAMAPYMVRLWRFFCSQRIVIYFSSS